MIDPTMFGEAWRFLIGLPLAGYVYIFWHVILFELPRYLVGFTITLINVWRCEPHPHGGKLPPLPKVSILLAGHNEEDAVEKCVRSLYEQSFNTFEIVCVDDGSTDRTYEIMCRLQRQGLVHKVARLDLRGGKSAGGNFAARIAAGEIFVVVDCDCSFEHDAIEELIRPLALDPTIAAVSGNILVRNWMKSVTTSLQGIEYLISISLGKTFSDMLNQVVCVSGAYGAFRRDAWNFVSGQDMGPGEDSDITMRMRLAGFKIVFTRHSICYTDAPDTLWGLIKQRNRWERDSFWLRFRKYKRTLNPFRSDFKWTEAVHQWDFFFFNILAAATFPFYLAFMLRTFGEYGVFFLVAASLGLYTLDCLTFICSMLATGRSRYWWLAPFLVIFGPFQSYVMRFVRLYSYIDEWVFSKSLTDNYVPQKVRDWGTWKR